MPGVLLTGGIPQTMRDAHPAVCFIAEQPSQHAGCLCSFV